jgi:hypothetical protein
LLFLCCFSLLFLCCQSLRLLLAFISVDLCDHCFHCLLSIAGLFNLLLAVLLVAAVKLLQSRLCLSLSFLLLLFTVVVSITHCSQDAICHSKLFMPSLPSVVCSSLSRVNPFGLINPSVVSTSDHSDHFISIACCNPSSVGVSVVSKASSLSLEFIHWCLLLDLCDHCRRVFAITALLQSSFNGSSRLRVSVVVVTVSFDSLVFFFRSCSHTACCKQLQQRCDRKFRSNVTRDRVYVTRFTN